MHLQLDVQAGDERAHSEQGSVYRVQVLDRAFRILSALASEEADVGLAELAGRLGLHKSTAHRLLMVLEGQQFVEKNGATGKYRLGSRLIELGRAAVARLNVYELSRPHLRELVDRTGETAHLAVIRDGEVVSIVNVESRQTVRMPATVGTRSPVHCTSLGKAILAFLPPAQAAEISRKCRLTGYTRKTITSLSRLRKELGAIRKRGYAIDDQEREEGLRCIGAPVFDHAGMVIAAVSIAGPAFRIRTDLLASRAAFVVRAAARISAAIGYRPPAAGGVS